MAQTSHAWYFLGLPAHESVEWNEIDGFKVTFADIHIKVTFADIHIFFNKLEFLKLYNKKHLDYSTYNF